MPDEPTFELPKVTPEMLEDFAAETLMHAAGMWEAIQARVTTSDEAISMLNDTLIAHFEEMVAKSQLTRPEAAPLSSEEEARLCDSMYLHVSNIAAAALALRPIHKAAAAVTEQRIVSLHKPN